MNFRRFFFFLLALTLASSCSAQINNEKIEIFIDKSQNSATKNSIPDEQKEKTLPQNKITVELAITSAQQARGFMGRKTIPIGTGMMFLYREDEKLQFWMKNTPHPLSIAFIDSRGVIREIYDMVPYSLQVIKSQHSVRYALEVPQGMFSQMGVVEGDALTYESLLLLKRKLVEAKK